MAAAAGRLAEIADGATFDVAVLGAGAGGMAAAVFAALDGPARAPRRAHRVPRRHLGALGCDDLGARHPARRHRRRRRQPREGQRASSTAPSATARPRRCARRSSTPGPRRSTRSSTGPRCSSAPGPFHPDYLYELEGSTSCGRALEPEPFDGRALGADLALIRPPIPEFTILGGMVIDRDDIRHLLKMKASAESFLYSARLIASYGLARLRHPRDPRLLMGNALIGRLLAAARRLGVTILTAGRRSPTSSPRTAPSPASS